MKISACLASLSAALLLTACGSPPPQLAVNGQVTVADMAALPAPTGVVDDPAADTYVIGPLDKVIVDVFGFESLTNRRFQVDASGFISIPLGGAVQVGGLTLEQAERRIEQQLRTAYVRNPQVSVNLEETNSRFVTVDGQVGVPGNYPLLNGMTLMRAVAAARGAGEFARLEDVVVFRAVQGRQMAALYDLSAIRRGAYADPRVYANDVIVVGDSPGRRLLRDLVPAGTLLTGPLIAVLNNL